MDRARSLTPTWKQIWRRGPAQLDHLISQLHASHSGAAAAAAAAATADQSVSDGSITCSVVTPLHAGPSRPTCQLAQTSLA